MIQSAISALNAQLFVPSFTLPDEDVARSSNKNERTTGGAQVTTWDSPLLSVPQERRTLRTVIVNADGTIQSAQINMTTMKVIPWQYKDYSDWRRKPKGTPPWAVETTPKNTVVPTGPPHPASGLSGQAQQHDNSNPIVFTNDLEAAENDRSSMVIPGEETPIAELLAKPDKSRKKLFNGVRMYLEDYLTLSDAVEAMPILDDLITGASLLDFGGNTRPINRRLLFALLQGLEFITPAAVKDSMGCSIRYSEKIASCLRVIVNAFVREAEAPGIH